MSDIDSIQLRNTFGKFMTGVTVVTALDGEGKPVGFTANSFSSVSLDPPLLLVCPAKSMSSFSVFSECEYFQVSVLAHDQQAVSNTFASSKGDRFSETKWYSDCNNCPVIEGAIASFSCKRNNSIDAGDHIILLGEVLEFNSNENLGLGYSEGGYFSLEMERKATELANRTLNPTATVIAGALLEYDGRLLVKHSADGKALELPQLIIDGGEPSFDELAKLLSNQLGVDVSVGSVFSVFDHETEDKTSIYYRASMIVETDELAKMSPYVFCKLNEIEANAFESKSTATMVARYLTEHESGNHSIYVGTDQQGKTHKIRARQA